MIFISRRYTPAGDLVYFPKTATLRSADLASMEKSALRLDFPVPLGL